MPDTTPLFWLDDFFCFIFYAVGYAATLISPPFTRAFRHYASTALLISLRHTFFSCLLLIDADTLFIADIFSPTRLIFQRCRQCLRCLIQIFFIFFALKKLSCLRADVCRYASCFANGLIDAFADAAMKAYGTPGYDAARYAALRQRWRLNTYATCYARHAAIAAVILPPFRFRCRVQYLLPLRYVYIRHHYFLLQLTLPPLRRDACANMIDDVYVDAAAKHARLRAARARDMRIASRCAAQHAPLFERSIR